ncbi:hypothetical protein AURDEDRAFT_111618 [Auricularia subglabra TFB-10046 SS5]|nr:hypothetical protein AURDEDRAFT_111618 [Auricularia subglabra TFB-10046 SS5]
MASPATATRPAARRVTPSTPSNRSSPTPPPSRTSPGLVRSTSSARAAAPPRPSSLSMSSARRAAPPVKSPTRETAPHPDELVATDGNDTLLLSLRRETEEKEELLVKVQNKDQQITQLQEENDNLSQTLSAAETRMSELYAEQERFESEMEGRLELIDKLRTQVRDLEKEKRDIQRRYNEQTSTFDAERQSFYDNEQHLKSRIQHLTQARKTITVPASPVAGQETDVEDDEEVPAAPQKEQAPPEDDEPPEMTALKLELNTLSVSHSSLQNTLQLLQTQLLDLKRVNHELQEENESYNMLLRERTLTGQFDPTRYAGAGGSGPTSSAGGEDEDDTRSTRSGAARSLLDRVPEVDEALELAIPQPPEDESDRLSLSVSRSGRPRPKGRSGTSSPPPRGENLGDLPITGPGLDLASELGRAENKDILEGRATVEDKFGKKGKHGREETADESDINALRNEVKALKDANKALSLYASKILDRIISEEGFEHVLAVDYTENKSPTSPRKIGGTASKLPPPTPSKGAGAAPAKKARPQSTSFFGKALASTTAAEPDKIAPSPAAAASSPPAPTAEAKRNRRSLSFDWKSFSLFGGDKNPNLPQPPETPGLKPLTLRPGATSTVMGTARKLDTQEDDEDRKERERLHATMKLMGYDPPAPAPKSPAPPPLAARSLSGHTHTSGSSSGPLTPEPRSPGGATPVAGGRFPFFRSRSAEQQQAQPGQALTAEALEQAEAEQSLAALDAREKAMSAELAKGRSGGFTEMSPRSSLGDEWRSRRSSRRSGGGSGSGSTVFSAGMSRGDGDADSLRRMSEEN